MIVTNVLPFHSDKYCVTIEYFCCIITKLMHVKALTHDFHHLHLDIPWFNLLWPLMEVITATFTSNNMMMLALELYYYRQL